MAKRGSRRKKAFNSNTVDVSRSSIKFWPMVHCPGCKRVLAFVRKPIVKRVRGSLKSLAKRSIAVKAEHFQCYECVKLKGYEIDFFAYKDRESILCPACGSKVVLNVPFVSSTKPTWQNVNDFKRKSDELSNP